MDPSANMNYDPFTPGEVAVPVPGGADAAVDRLDELISAYLEDNLDAPSLAELNRQLAADPEARQKYLSAARLHADLLNFFREPPGGESEQP